ncbi:GPI mannosyltransferase 2 [Pelobates cultripes]|uniref:GPI mannosyltransferase 2 n=1 Tax=Pelobates cultripes TaxID=61616 RepID=A0AAD1R0U8_PELCU|nr:GPI mannosyltransferase 2 [Pelobates cultripes]
MWWTWDPFLKEVFRFSLCSRGITLAMQIVFNTLIPDHKADAFSPPHTSPDSTGDHLTEFLLGGLGRWDAEHFLFIAEHGYVYEHNMAFFPLLPLCLTGLANGPLYPLKWMLTLRSRLLVSAALLNCFCFTLAAISLYLLGCVALQSRSSAFLASLLFCMSPASIFMTAAYSESLFALATFIGLWLLEKHMILRGCIFLSLATASRSNGMTNVGFLLHAVVQSLVNGSRNCHRMGRTFLGTFVVILPFALFQYFSYSRFCLASATKNKVPRELVKLAITKEYRLPGAQFPTWCSTYLPMAYSSIQSEYWGVGFLHYFQLRQLPNFLLALPVILLSTRAIWEYFQANPYLCISLGLRTVQLKSSSGYCGHRVFLYVAHITALVVFGVLCMHIQVLTRLLLSSSPVLFWYCSHQLQKNEPWIWGLERGCVSSNPAVRLLRSWKSLQPQTRVLLGYFLVYWILGTALHVNFLPWT